MSFTGSASPSTLTGLPSSASRIVSSSDCVNMRGPASLRALRLCFFRWAVERLAKVNRLRNKPLVARVLQDHTAAVDFVPQRRDAELAMRAWPGMLQSPPAARSSTRRSAPKWSISLLHDR